MEFITTPEPGGNNELISCICVTKGDPLLLRRSIACFRAQSYRNKELVIVFEADADHPLDMTWTVGPAIRLVPVGMHPRTSLGELRNIGIRAASGPVICQWDDDDWYHADRLTHQYSAMLQSGRNGSVLSQWTVFDGIHQRAYLSNNRLWEGSILCRKNVLLKKPYEDKALGEDTATIDYLAALRQLEVMDAAPSLYIYVYHGSNTWHQEHWKHIFACGQPLPASTAKNIARVLAGELSVQEGSAMLFKSLGREAFYS